MTGQEISTGTRSGERAALTEWLRRRVAFYLDVEPDGIDPAAGLADQGLDSLYLSSVISDVEEHLDIEVDDEEIRRHATVDAVASYLVDLRASRACDPTADVAAGEVGGQRA